jgi:hypothetical protein
MHQQSKHDCSWLVPGISETNMFMLMLKMRSMFMLMLQLAAQVQARLHICTLALVLSLG